MYKFDFDKSNNAANVADGDQLTNFSAQRRRLGRFIVVRDVIIILTYYVRT